MTMVDYGQSSSGQKGSLLPEGGLRRRKLSQQEMSDLLQELTEEDSSIEQVQESEIIDDTEEDGYPQLQIVED